MTAQPVTLVLPPALTFEACDDLFAALMQAQGADLILDGSHVTRLGGLAAQLLAAASIIWATAGHNLTLSNASETLCRGLGSLALWPLPTHKGAAR